MCIMKVESWAFAGKNYGTELEAVKAALIDIGTRFVKEFHSDPLGGLIELGSDVSELRIRYLELTCGPTQGEEAPPKVLEGTRGDPSESLLTPKKRVERIIRERVHMSNSQKAATKKAIEDSGWIRLDDLLRAAKPSDLTAIEIAMGIVFDPAKKPEGLRAKEWNA